MQKCSRTPVCFPFLVIFSSIMVGGEHTGPDPSFRVHFNFFCVIPHQPVSHALMTWHTMLPILALFSSSLALDASEAWTTCGGLSPQYNRTACPLSTSTCCTQNWMPSKQNWGCCPYPHATCCSNGYTCCPVGTTCSDSGSEWNIVTTCVDARTGKQTPPGADGGGQQVCKTGGPLLLSETKHNVIILGDSVSIGYEPKVAALMSESALVQHSPWDLHDGGAEETKYGDLCLDFLLRAPDGTPQYPDVLFFNFGLHNIGNDTIPGQAGPVAQYAPYLDKIATRLSALATDRPGTRLLFGLTTPFMCDGSLDATIRSNNVHAAAIMKKHGIPTVDLHAPIISQCGASPQATCFNQSQCFCPHCPMADGVGYEWLAKNVVVPAINMLLPSTATPKTD
jgi:hypothetical protein